MIYLILMAALAADPVPVKVDDPGAAKVAAFKLAVSRGQSKLMAARAAIAEAELAYVKAKEMGAAAVAELEGLAKQVEGYKPGCEFDGAQNLSCPQEKK